MAPILILHGWGAGSKNWERLKNLFEGRGYPVFLPDLPGFGRNPPPKVPWTIDNYREWVRDYCQENGLERIFLLGHSFGGSVAAELAVKYPSLVAKLVLIDSAGIREKKVAKALQKNIAHSLSKFSFLPFYSFFRKLVYKFFFRSDYLSIEGTMRQTYLNVIEEDISNDFAYISVPTLLVWGERDKITPLEQAYFIQKRISSSRLEILPGTDHNPHVNCPERLSEVVINFLNES